MNTPRLWTVCTIGLVSLFATTSIFAQSSSTVPRYIHIDQVLTASIEAQLKRDQVTLYHAFGEGIYLASGTSALLTDLPLKDKEALENEQFQAVDAHLLSERSASEQRFEIVIAHPDLLSDVKQVLAKAGFVSDDEQIQGGVTITGRTSLANALSILRSPYVVHVNLKETDALVPYHFEGRVTSAVTVLNSGIPGAPNLNGDGIVLGVGDGGMLSGHPDIGDRVVSTTTYYNSGWGNHPDMVSGIMAGAGNVNPRHRGIACESELVIEPTSGITFNAPQRYTDFGMTITNNSYGPSFHCASANRYYGTSSSIDAQLFSNPEIMHVYAVGNSGRSSCNGLPTSYGTIPGGAQTSKNVISVGNIQVNRTRFVSSSAGPTLDGRLKPEIVAIGHSVTSNNRDNAYSTGTGTSYAAPSVAATLGLLSQRYKQLNASQNPPTSVLKAIVCNTATDLGAAQPDYQYGYGLIDAQRALQAIEESRYSEVTLAQGQNHTQTLQIPSSVEVAKFMIYWPDQAGPTTNSGPTLINDFDLKIVTPQGDTLLPWVLDPLNPTAIATQKIDTLNNIEQVTITNPAAGTYKLIVEAKTLPMGSTPLVTTWDFQLPYVMITCPYGGEVVDRDSDILVAWNNSEGQPDQWSLEYRSAGGNWTSATTSGSTANNYVMWSPPMNAQNCELRIVNTTTGATDQTNSPLTFLDIPESFEATTICDGDLSFSWDASDGASSYTLYKYDGSEMAPVQTLTDTFVVLTGLTQGEEHLYSVAANAAGGQSTSRATAIWKSSEINGPDCQSPLPLTWLSVTTQEHEGGIRIGWEVADVINNNRYEVLRGQPFGDTLNWEIIRTVGEQNLFSYEIDDKTAPLIETVYYKIRQVDNDGQSSDSPIVAHERNVSPTTSLNALTNVQNPVRDVLRFDNQTGEIANLEIFDTAGRLLGTLQAAQGPNQLIWPPSLQRGMYILKATAKHSQSTIRILHQ